MTYRHLAGPAAALALLGPFAHAMADSASTVQLYGFAAPMWDRVSVSGATRQAPANVPGMLSPGAYRSLKSTVTRMSSSTTHFGLRGSENLGNGWRTIFQLESGFRLNDGAFTGGANARPWNRNSRLGLSHPAFGTLFAGIWDTPAAWSHLGFTNGARNPYTGDSSAIFVTPGFNIPHSASIGSRTNTAADASFNRRQSHSVQYWSPAWAGFSFRLAYARPTHERMTAANGTRYSPSVMGLGLEYASGPVVLRYVYQQHKNYFGLAWVGPNPAANPDAPGSSASGSRDAIHRIVARYAINGNWTLQGAIDRLDYRAQGVAAGAVRRYMRDAYSAQVLYRQHPHTLWLNLGLARDGRCSRAGGASCSSSGLGASMWSLGYRYDLSRRTGLFASAYQVRNRHSGQYGVFPRSQAGIPPGARHTGITLGLEHAF